MRIAALAIIGPLAAAVVILLTRRRAGAWALLGAGVGMLAALATLVRIADGARFTQALPGLPDWPFLLVVDPLGAVYSATVAVVGTFVLVYAHGYMTGERDQARFFAGMLFFIGAMQTLVVAGDWILLLTAWELIGLASYLLIGFWFERPGVGGAATRAFVVTRAADVGLYLGIIILIADTGTTAIDGSRHVTGSAATWAGLALLVAAIGKSAQAPLQGWLQDAMVGPTPVSALLHAATLVVAGVVLLSRALPFLPDRVLLVVGVVGGGSAVITGLTAWAQPDLKRLLAASTSSQLGLMVLAIGAGALPAAVFHLVTHAAMKSTLFLTAGVFQHDRQSTSFDDLQGIGRRRRATFAAFVVAGVALAGVPPLAGFWSKDAVIAAAMESSAAIVLLPLAVVAAMLTGVYIGRASRLLWEEEAAPPAAAEHPVRGMRWMGTGIAVLVVLAAGLGLADGPLERLLNADIPADIVSMGIGTVTVITGLLVGWLVPAIRIPGHAIARGGFRLAGGWTVLVVRPVLVLATWCDQADRTIHAGVLAAGRRVLSVASQARTVDDGVEREVYRVGRGALRIAQGSRSFDEERIDGLIALLVHRVRRFGVLARHLQTGLVHRELLVAVSGAAVAVLILVLIR